MAELVEDQLHINGRLGILMEDDGVILVIKTLGLSNSIDSAIYRDGKSLSLSR